MTDEPMTEPDPAAAPGERVDAGPSKDLAVPARRPVVRPVRRPGLAVRARRQLAELRQNPTAMVAVSAAATVGSALVTAGLRRTLRTTPLSPGSQPARRTSAVAISGYVVHEVHVVHHVVHHVIAPPAASAGE